jgi:hypothetical protein
MRRRQPLEQVAQRNHARTVSALQWRVFHVKHAEFQSLRGRIHTMHRSTSRPGTANGST